MTDETFDRIAAFVRRNSVESDLVGSLGQIPIYVSEEVADDHPDLSEEPYAVGIRLSSADFHDLAKRLKKLQMEAL